MTGAAATLARLPGLIRHLEQGAAACAAGHVRLHPETVAALARAGRRTSAATWLAWGLAALFATLLLVT
jgi:hypothetical protein